MKKVVVYIITAAVIFATMEVALKAAGTEIDSMQLTFLRFFIGGMVLLPPAAVECRKSGYRLNAKDLGWIVLLGTICIPVSMMAFQIGVLRCNAATAAPLFCTNPLFTMPIAHVFASEKMDRKKAAALFIGAAAVLLMIRPWDVQQGNSVSGILIMLFASVSFAVYTVMGKKSIRRIGTYMQTSLSFIIGSLILLVIMMFTGHPVLADIAGNLPIILYSGVVVTGIGYLVYFLAIRYSDATTGSITFFIKPALAPIFAVIFLHESIVWNTIAGVILLILASILSMGTVRENSSSPESSNGSETSKLTEIPGLDPQKAALLIIDMQKAFVETEAALCIRGAKATVPACAAALGEARRLGVKIIWVKREYAEDGSDMEIPRLKMLEQLGIRGVLAPGSTGINSVEEPEGLTRLESETVLIKPRWSAFFGTDLDEMLKSSGINTVILAGTTTPNCIRMTCYDAIAYDYRTVVLSKCTSSQTEAIQTANLEDMRRAGAEIL